MNKPIAWLPILWVCAIAGLTGLGACREEIPLKLTTRQAELADTIFVRQVKELKIRLDSLCEADFDVRVQRMVDSMLVVRREEEAQLRARIRVLEQQLK